MALFFGLLVAAATGTVSSCSSSSAAEGVSDTCSINSDCNPPFICAFGKCHEACVKQEDCDLGERCVATTGGGVCQLAAESSCSGTTLCQTGEVCGEDGQCRAICSSAGGTPCPSGDYCLTTGLNAGACYAPSASADKPALVSAGVISKNGKILTDASTVMISSDASTDGSNGKPDGTTPGKDGSGGGTDGTTSDVGTVVTNSCPSAQTQFGFTAQGESNPSFTSAVGVRAANALLVFSGYSGPAPSKYDAGGADGGSVNLVYVQAFDPASAKSLGPAVPLFQAAAGTGFFVYSAAISAAGQIALAYGYGPFSEYGSSATNPAILYAAFLDIGGDAGASGVELQRIVLLESGTYYGIPRVIWSAPSQAFVFSWEYEAASSFFGKVVKFLPNGASAGGDTDVVPTDNALGTLNSGNVDQVTVGGSGGIFGVAFIGYSAYPYLTILAADGTQVGATFPYLDSVQPDWVTIAGTSSGFVYLFDDGSGVVGRFIPVSSGAPVLPPDGGTLATLGFTGSIHAVNARALADDSSAGGAGVALLYGTNVSFAYIKADGTVKLQPNQVFSHTYVAGDEYSISVLGGSFAVALYDSVAHSTQVAASGCVQ